MINNNQEIARIATAANRLGANFEQYAVYVAIETLRDLVDKAHRACKDASDCQDLDNIAVGLRVFVRSAVDLNTNEPLTPDAQGLAVHLCYDAAGALACLQLSAGPEYRQNARGCARQAQAAAALLAACLSVDDNDDNDDNDNDDNDD